MLQWASLHGTTTPQQAMMGVLTIYENPDGIWTSQYLDGVGTNTWMVWALEHVLKGTNQDFLEAGGDAK